MAEDVEIRGGATEFEAAVIGVVVDRIIEEESLARERSAGPRRLPAWVRALRPEERGGVPEEITPDRV